MQKFLGGASTGKSKSEMSKFDRERFICLARHHSYPVQNR